MLPSQPSALADPSDAQRLDDRGNWRPRGGLSAHRDMEIRGAGRAGCGTVRTDHQVGFSLYLTMESAVAALRRGDIPDIDQPLDTGTEVKHVPALIPDDYLPDISTRLVL